MFRRVVTLAAACLLLTAGPLFAAPGNLPASVRITDATGASVVTVTSGNLSVTCASGCSGSTFADSAAFTAGTTVISIMGGDFDDTPPTAITTGHAAAARITANRAVHTNLRDASGNQLLGQLTMAGSIPVVIASNQSNLPANITQVGGSALALGAAAMSASIPVTISSNQTYLPPAAAYGGITTFAASPTSVSGGATTTITCSGTATSSQPTEMMRFAVQGSTNARVSFQYNNNASLTVYDYCATSAINGRCEVKPTKGAWRLTAGSTGTQAWQAVVTNVDSNAQEFTCSTDSCTGSACL